MTMYYSAADYEYVKAHTAARLQAEANLSYQSPPTQITETVADIPDMNEAERIWKLLVSAAQN